MKKPKRALPALLGVVIWAAAVAAQELPPEAQPDQAAKTGLELGGAIEANYSFFGARKDSPLYKLQYYNQTKPDYLSSYPLDLYLNGDYQTKDIGVHFKTLSEYSNPDQTSFNLLELYGSLNLYDTSFLLLGKKAFKWGKGYAFNPVSYVSPEKDPENPELAQAGILSLNFQYSKSFQAAALNNVTIDLLVIPPGKSSTARPYDFATADVAGKLYLLLWDTDIDFMGYYSAINPEKYGLDFSRNLTPELELHGEFSRFNDQVKYGISSGALQAEKISGFSWLAGLRWLNAWNMTTILEYFHNGAGMTGNEFSDYVAFLGTAAASGSSATISQALNTNKTYFSTPNPMSDYVYLKISWPEPFNLVDFTPSTYAIYNIMDMSASAGVSFSYKPVTNFELVFQPVFFIGAGNAEFGLKQYIYKASILARFFF